MAAKSTEMCEVGEDEEEEEEDGACENSNFMNCVFACVHGGKGMQLKSLTCVGVKSLSCIGKMYVLYLKMAENRSLQSS